LPDAGRIEVLHDTETIINTYLHILHNANNRWIANGAAYYILLFTSNEWQRLIPTSWSIFPNALHDMMLYATFHFNLPGNPYDYQRYLARLNAWNNNKNNDKRCVIKLIYLVELSSNSAITSSNPRPTSGR
jgi:hypothetical protein